MTPRQPAKKSARKTPAKKAATSSTKKAPTRTRAGAAPKKKAAAPRQPRGAAAEARAAKVLELRLGGATLEAIATQLKYRDVAAAHAAYEQALAPTLPPTPEEGRRAEVAELEKRHADLLPKALDGDLEALNHLVDVAAARARIGVELAPESKHAGPTERATLQEIATLGKGKLAPALCAAAAAVAREVDEARDQPGLLATAARELRMTMSQLRGLAVEINPADLSGGDDPEKKAGDSEPDPVVVEAARLEALRKKAGRS